ncbi:MAG: TIM barrel protein [Anaerolineales bacterium]|nr:TIM barrel protein [Anaerolineales bacterium]
MPSLHIRFGTVGSPKSTPKKPGGSVGTIQHLAHQDLRALELGWVRSVRVSETTCQKIKMAGEENDVALSVHAPYFINLNADDEEWPKSRKRLMDAAHYGNLAGATDIVFHPGSYFGQPPEQVLQVALPRLRDCMTELRAAANPVILRPETMGKGAMLGSLHDTLLMAKQIDGVEPCLDFAHLHARTGDGGMNSYDEWVSMFKTYAGAIGDASLKHLHCHLSGIEYGPKGERNHLMLNDSDFDLIGLLRAMAHMGCSGRILCESPERMDEDALNIKSVWEDIISDELED